ncbi:MAG: hypothetical protein EBS53_13375 [Bacteroidetes bacterium]|nr:hypothetical protein [Bacteroidota bacterium]
MSQSHKHLAFHLVIALVLFPNFLEAQLSWAPAKMMSAEEIAARGVLVPIPIPTKLSNFRYPFLQEDGSVVFIANDHHKPKDQDGRAGIFKFAPNGEVTTITTAGEGLGSSGAKVAGVYALKVEGGRAVFHVMLENEGSGIALWENGKLSLLAATTGSDGFSDFGNPDLSGDIVVFSAKTRHSGQSLYAVNLQGVDRTPVAIVPHGLAIPGQVGLTYQKFADNQFADGKNAVFRAYSDEYTPFQGPGPRYAGVFRVSALEPDAPKKIVDLSTPLPGAPPGATFGDYQESAIPADGTTILVNRSGQLRGIYRASPGGEIECLVDSTTTIPDLFTGPFTYFNKWVCNTPPWVLFLGRAKEYFGLFAINWETRELYLLADSRMVFDGKKIKNAEISNAAKVDDRVALMLEFEDGGSGVYVATFEKGLAMKSSPGSVPIARP